MNPGKSIQKALGYRNAKNAAVCEHVFYGGKIKKYERTSL